MLQATHTYGFPVLVSPSSQGWSSSLMSILRQRVPGHLCASNAQPNRWHSTQALCPQGPQHKLYVHRALNTSSLSTGPSTQALCPQGPQHKLYVHRALNTSSMSTLHEYVRCSGDFRKDSTSSSLSLMVDESGANPSLSRDSQIGWSSV